MRLNAEARRSGVEYDLKAEEKIQMQATIEGGIRPKHASRYAAAMFRDSGLLSSFPFIDGEFHVQHEIV